MSIRFFISLISIFIFLNAYSQETTTTNTEQQLENLTDNEQAETEDDSYLQQLEYYRKNPLNINSADENDFRELKILSGLQISNLISYRKLFGNFISIYELQAIPYWDIATIKKVLPFITASRALNVSEDFLKRFKGGDQVLLMRLSRVLERSKGFDPSTTGTKYLGGPGKYFFRYRYQYKNLLQFGVVGDKDAGEQFFKGAQNKGFDFYSAHLFVRKIGAIQSLALGDFTVNMGQGLIQWQSLAFRKSVDVLGIKRQSPVLRPYNSAGEFNFHRGAGITIQKGKLEATVFASIRKLSANFVADTVNHEDFISSIINSGYHRTANEVSDRNILKQQTLGGNVKFKTNNWHVGINGIFYNFSTPIKKRQEPYNLYAISGKSWNNFSVDYSYTYRSLHFFGEAAADKNMNKAFLNGLLMSVDPRVDISFVHRNIDKAYQAINGNAFTENTYPTNESGLFSGITIRPTAIWRIDAYMDLFKFPWLKYLVDAPSSGNEFLTQVTYTPNRQLEVYTRFRNERKQSNQSDNATTTNFLVTIPRQNWRTQFIYKVSPSLALRSRVELLWYDKKGGNAENGFMTFFDFIYKPLMKPISGNIRLQYFETDDYNSRIYAYENDVLYYFSIPVFYTKGYRYYLNLNADLSKKLSLWLKWSQTIYEDRNSIGSGLDEINGSLKSEVRVLVRVNF